MPQNKLVKTDLCVWDSFAKFILPLSSLRREIVYLWKLISALLAYFSEAEEDANIHQECQQPWINPRTQAIGIAGGLGRASFLGAIWVLLERGYFQISWIQHML